MKKFSTNRAVLEREVEISWLRVGGPGGQHRNKAETGVRIHHPPSGETGQATENRSRTRNMEVAWERLLERLEKRNHRPKKRRPTRPTRGSKERRLAGKRKTSEKKALRRGPEDS